MAGKLFEGIKDIYGPLRTTLDQARLDLAKVNPGPTSDAKKAKLEADVYMLSTSGITYVALETTFIQTVIVSTLPGHPRDLCAQQSSLSTSILVDTPPALSALLLSALLLFRPSSESGQTWNH